jgi:dTDP-glucose 4,6-dehydratase
MNRVKVSDYISKKLSEYGVKRVYGIMGGGFEQSNIKTVRKVINTYYNQDIEDYQRFVDFGAERPGQDVRYALNDQKIRRLGWEPSCDFDTEIIEIVEYYKDNFIW